MGSIGVAPVGENTLDEYLGGGLPRGGTTLLVGTTGTGKSILSLQWLAEGARRGETCVYVSTTIPVERIKAYYGTMPFLKDVADSIRWYHMSADPKELIPFTFEKQIRFFSHSMPDMVAEDGQFLMKVDRLVLDSITTIEKLISDPALYRFIIYRIIKHLYGNGITTLLVEEKDMADISWGETRNFVEAVLYLERIDLGGYTRAMKILKRYGVNHPIDWIPYTITGNGIKL